MYEVVQSDLALDDLDKILRYIVTDLGNPSAATTLLDEIARCHSNLGSTPAMYEMCRDYRLNLLGYRKVVIKNYLILYQIDEAHKTVNIIRYIYAARDYGKLV